MEGNAEIVTFAVLRQTSNSKVNMTYHIRTIILSAMFSFAAGGMQAAKYMMPMHSPWSITTELSAEQTFNSSFDEINIRTEGRRVHVSGAEDKTLEVYNIAGVKVASFPIDAPEKTITLTVPKGIYILRVEKVTRKVNVL